MGTLFFGEGNIGTKPELKLFPGNGNQAPRGLLRLNVRFDNLVPVDDAMIDRGGFWANVEIWHRDAALWESIYQQGLRVMVHGRMQQDTWTDQEGHERSAFKVVANRVGILPYRVAQVIVASASEQRTGQHQQDAGTAKRGAASKDAGLEGEWANPSKPDDDWVPFQV